VTDAAWLRATRDTLGLSQAELADALGITQASVSRMEAGEQPVTRRTRLQVEALRREAAPR
jgi:transcriptional regulator with XRE-family HTH domain